MWELCFAELALARRAGVVATRNLTADALDLRHRLPRLYTAVRELQVEVWVARKIAVMTRPLSPEAAELVDEAKVRQLGLGAYRWTSPHGITKVVTPRGTRDVQLLGDSDSEVSGELYYT